MSIDISRDTFDEAEHFTGVYAEQGRPILDADWNEATAISQHYARTALADIVGLYGTPKDAHGFCVETTTVGAAPGVPASDNVEIPLVGDPPFHLVAGHLFAKGLLLETESNTKDQPSTAAALPANTLLYLEAREEDVSASQDPRLLDDAFGGIETAARRKVIWEMKTALFGGANPPVLGYAAGPASLRKDLLAQWPLWIKALDPDSRMELQVRFKIPAASACGGAPVGRYTGEKSRLYRIQIHRQGDAMTGTADADRATFKWSRDNGSVTARILDVAGNSPGSTTFILTLNANASVGFRQNSWVELCEEGQWRGSLYQVQLWDAPTLTVVGSTLSANARWLRRWDHLASSSPKPLIDGAIPIQEGGTNGDPWYDLGDGLEISFPASAIRFKACDSWTIAARPSMSGDGAPPPAPSARFRPWKRYFAPLAIVRPPQGVEPDRVMVDVRGIIPPLVS